MYVEVLPFRPEHLPFPDHARRKAADRRVVALHGEAQLLQVVGTLHPPRGFPRRLHRRQEQRNQDADDRDDGQQLHESKRRTNSRLAGGLVRRAAMVNGAHSTEHFWA